jgi:hypothetical protein
MNILENSGDLGKPFYLSATLKTCVIRDALLYSTSVSFNILDGKLELLAG